MEHATLDDLMALNDQLAALVEAGVPLELGLDGSVEDAAAALERINAAVARRVSRGESLVDALESDQQTIPARYRSVVQIGLKSGDMHAAIDAASQSAEFKDQTRYSIRSAFFYPLVVCFLAAVGLAGYCTFVVPKLEDFRQEFRMPEGAGLHTLQSLRGLVPGGLIILAVVVMVVVVRHFVTSGRHGSAGGGDGLIARLLGAARTGQLERYATFSQSLASLLAADVPIAEGLLLAAGVSGDAGLRAGAQQLAPMLHQGQAVSDEDPAAKAFPPFLRWALLRAEPAVDRVRTLEMAADLYRQSAARRSDRVRVVAPILTSVLVGGSAVLLYGLALFVPLVEMIENLALQR